MLLWILRFDFMTWLLIEQNTTCEFIDDFGVVSETWTTQWIAFLLRWTSFLNGYKFYKFFKDNIILSKMFYLLLKSTELPDVGPREFYFLSTQENENVKPRKARIVTRFCGLFAVGLICLSVGFNAGLSMHEYNASNSTSRSCAMIIIECGWQQFPALRKTHKILMNHYNKN